MKLTINELEDYLLEHYSSGGIDQSLFMKLVEEIGEVAEVLNKKAGRKASDNEDLQSQLGKELADVIHYAVAIAALNGIDMNDAILAKDKKASVKYNHSINLEQFILDRRNQKQTDKFQFTGQYAVASLTKESPVESMPNDEYSFRQALPENADEIYSLYRSVVGDSCCSWDEEYPVMHNVKGDLNSGSLYVLCRDSRIIGAASVVAENELDGYDCWSNTSKAHKEIARVVVDKAFQRRGLSLVIVDSIIREIKKERCHSVRLSVSKSNIPAYKTYIKAGFKTAGEAEMYGGSYYLMEKLI